MSSIRLKHASGNSMSLAAPGTNPASNLELKLPHTIGSANQLLKVDGSGQLGWATDNSGVSLSGSTNNTIATVTGANALIGESELTYTGGLLKVAAGYPTFYLDDTTTTNNRFRLTHNNELTQFEADPNNVYSNSRIQFDIDGSERLRITSAGRVGIGVATPGCKLNIKADGSASDGLQVTSSGHSSYVWQIQNNDNLFNGSLAGELGIRGSSGISFSANAGSSTHFRITSAGLVGINCTPNKQLEVKGTDVAFRLLSTVATGRIGMEFYDTSAQKGYFGYASSSNNEMSIQQNEAADLWFYVNGGERLRIKSDGDIEVGGNLKTNNLSGRNLLINGDFSVWQRGSSFNIAAPIYTADRWNTYGASTSQMTISRESFNVGQTDVTDNPKYMLRMSNVPDADSTWMQMYQRIEDVTQFSNTQLTISFWIRTNNATNNYYWQFVQRFGTGGSTAVSTNTSTFNTTTSWVKHTFTVTVPSISGKTVGTGNNLEVHFLNNSTTGNDTYIDFANIQVEKGTIATSFERRSYQEELAKCQRYFAVYHPTSQERIYIEGSSTNHRWWEHPIPAGMRTEPSIAKGGTCSSLSISMAGSLTINGLAVTGVDNGGSGGTLHPGSMGNVSYRVSTTGTGGSQYSVRHTDGWENGAGWITMDAEL